MKDSSRYLSTESLMLGLMANTSDYDVRFVSGENPYKLRIDGEDIFVYIKNLSPAQLSNKNPDIWRVQLPVKEDFDQIKNSESLFILLGYDAENDVYTSWNPYWCKQRLNVGKSVSLYSRYSLQKRVRETGEIEKMSLNNESDVVCLPAKSLYQYIKNIKAYFPTESLYVAKGSRINKRAVNDPQALFDLFVSFDDCSKFEAYMRSIGMSERAIKDYVRNLRSFQVGGFFNKYKEIFLQCSSIDDYDDAIKDFRSQPDILAIDEKNHGYLRAALRHYVKFMKVLLSGTDDEPSLYDQPQEEEKKPYELDSFGKLIELDPVLTEQLLPFVIGEDYPDYDEMINIAVKYYPQKVDENMAYSDWIELFKRTNWKKKRAARQERPNRESAANGAGNIPARYEMRKQFWAEFIQHCEENNGVFIKISPVTANWISKSLKTPYGININAVVGFDYDRVEIYIDTKDKDFNKILYDDLYAKKIAIEAEYGGSLFWERMSDKRACRIKDEISCHTFEMNDKTEVFEFMRTSADKMYSIFHKYIIEFSIRH